MGDDPLEDVKRRVQDQASITQRLQFELETHIKEIQPFMENFYKFVMDPVDGLVVKQRHLERSVEVLDKSLAAEILESEGYSNMMDRIKMLEDASRDAKATRRWIWRDVIIMGAVSIGLALVTAFLTSRLVH